MKLKLLFLVLFLIVFCIEIFAQKEGNIWYFGQYAGIDFNYDPPQILTNSAMSLEEGCASISDTSGSLLFYTNGQSVWNKNHQLMPNGTGLYGDNSSTQSAMIVPKPGSNNIIFIFTVDNEAGPYGLQYSVVDMNQNSGLGDIISKNQSLITPTAEKITAVKHKNGRDIWVITHGFNNSRIFYAYKVSNIGINTTPVMSSVGSIHGGSIGNSVGCLKASSDGEKLALAIYDSDLFELFDFNRSTGEVSNSIILQSYNKAYGVEFSPDGTKLYGTGVNILGFIYQFDLNAGSPTAIKNSATLIGTTASSRIGTLQLGPNGKIYVARGYTTYLGVINNPNIQGNSCNYVDNGLYLGGKMSTYGLPSFVQSFFHTPEFEAYNLCYGDSTTFNITDTLGLDSVFWSFDDNLSGANNYSKLLNPIHIFSDTGIFEVQLISYIGILSDTVKRNIKINPLPGSKFFINDSLQCFNNNNFVFINFTPSNANYIWKFGDGNTSSAIIPTHIFTTEDTFKVWLISTSAFGCRDSVFKNAFVYSTPDAVFNISDSSQCHDNNQFSFTNNSTINTGTLTYYWDFGDGDSSSFKNPNHSYTFADTFKVKLTATSGFGCKNSITKLTITFASPVADFSINDSAQCLKSNNFIFSNKSSIQGSGQVTTLSYLWDFGDNDTSSSDSSEHIYYSSGTYDVWLTVTSDLGCKDSLLKKTIVFNSPSAAFSVNDSVQCLKDNNFIFTNNSTISSGNLNYQWYFGDGNVSQTQNSSHNYASIDTFGIKLVVNSNNACADSITKNVYIASSPTAAFIMNDSIQCLENNNFVFTNLSSVNSGALTYLWDFGDGIISTSDNPVHNYNNDNIFNILLVTTSINGCLDSTIKRTYVYPIPNVNFTVNDSQQCLNGNNFIFSNQSTVNFGSLDYYWDFNDGNYSSAPDPDHVYISKGIYLVELVVINENVCSDSLTEVIEVWENPTADFVANVVENNEEVSFINNSAGAIDLYWNFGDGELSDEENPVHNFYKQGKYSVTLHVSNLHCSDTISKEIEITAILRDIFIPNTFTPNGDNLNDTFEITGIDYNFFKYDLLILSSWGELVYDSRKETKKPAWDGKFKGSLVPTGLYYYTIKSHSIHQHGSIKVIY